MRHLAALLGLAVCASSAHAAEPNRYMGVVDAGSSASRLYVYRVTDVGGMVEDVLEIAVDGPPLASHAGDPAAGDKAIRPLLGALDRALTERGVSKQGLQIHVLATGGMRLLEPAAARDIENSVRRTLAEGGFQPGRVATISGEMEGVYAWLDVNMLLGRLAPGVAPAGIVEVGGASMQIAYAGAPATDPGVVAVTLGDATYNVRSVSLLGLGIDQARKSLLASPDAAACFPPGVVSARPDLRDVAGAFDAARCAKAFEAIVAGPAQALAHTEYARGGFVGLGRPLSGVLVDWKLPQDRPAALKDVAGRQCALPWDAFKRVAGDTPYTPYLCANSIYLSTLLFAPGGLGLAPEQVRAVETIDNRRPSWTRGAALTLRN